MKFRLICLCLIFFSCSRDKNKPYENVNIIREEKSSKLETPETIIFPKTLNKPNSLILEVDKSDIRIISTDLDSIIVDNSFKSVKSKDVDFYEGNGQLIIKEKGRKDELKGNVWTIYSPKFMNINIKSQNGNILIKGINGTFDINSPVGDTRIENSSSAAKIISQSGKIELSNWQIMGRSKLSSASAPVSLSCDSDFSFSVTIHSGSDAVSVDLQGHKLQSNLELLTFKGEGEVISDFRLSPVEDFYSDALERYYDLRKVQLGDNFPISSISSGTGTISIRK